ncbi:angiopoietin-like protein 8 [Rhinatrema bivittatum]|uniref:angiopoietin-like protein 8 n=1 Tax=Rhinatrema bivittatum TaxID=194408 RepID=UPI001128A22B|nr:angiopoietin-like protein 8 [Rhinatrema bivittatum]
MRLTSLGIHRALRGVLEGQRSLQEHVGRLESRVGGLRWRPAGQDPDCLSALRARAERQGVTLRYLRATVRRQQRQMERQRAHLAQVKQQMESQQM